MRRKNKTFTAYAKLKKPFFAPPPSLFGPVWSFLYAVIFISFGYVFYQSFVGNLPSDIFIPFGLNLLFNGLYFPIQFKLKDTELATVDIILVLLTLVWAIQTIFKLLPIVAFIQIPYLLWISFATILQISIWWLNRK